MLIYHDKLLQIIINRKKNCQRNIDGDENIGY